MTKCLLLILLMVVGCGVSKKTPVNSPTNPIAIELQDQIDRITPMLYKCDGLPVGSGSNDKTGRKFCDSSNGLMWGNFLLTVKDDAEIVQGIKDSFAPNGKLYRSPEHLRYNDNVNENSRDNIQLYLSGLVKTKDINQLNLFWNYARANKFIICNGKEDAGGLNRCLLTPSMLYFIGEIYAYLGQPKPPETKINENIIVATALVDANTVPVNYRMMLVANQVYLKMLTNKMSKPWVQVTDVLSKRSPDNLWYKYLSNAAHDGNLATYEEISKQLIQRMENFNTVGTSWIWSQGTDPQGWDLLFLAYRLKPELTSKPAP